MACVAQFNLQTGNATVPDNSGFLHTGSLVGTASYTDGHTGRGLNCAAGGISIPIPSGDYSEAPDTVTLMAWVKLNTATAGNRFLVGRAHNGNTTGYSWALYASDTNGYIRFIFDNTVIATTSSILDGQWHHVCAVAGAGASGDDIHIYVDGIEVATGTHPGIVGYTTAHPITVGYSSTQNHYLDGVVDDVRVFNDPMDTDDVVLYRDAPVTEFLLAAYNFNEGSGSAATDYSGYGRDLTLTANGEWISGPSDGTAISPIANTGAAAQNLNADWPGFDRFAIMGWVKVVHTGAVQPILTIEDSAGNPKVRVFRGSSNACLCKVLLDSTGIESDYFYREFGPGGVGQALDPVSWHWVVVKFSPVTAEVWVDGNAGEAIMNVGSEPTNDPLITEADRIRVGGDASNGTAAWDNLRIIKNWVTPREQDLYRDMNVVAPQMDWALSGTISGAPELVSPPLRLGMALTGQLSGAPTLSGDLAISGAPVDWSLAGSIVGGPTLVGGQLVLTQGGPRDLTVSTSLRTPDSPRDRWTTTLRGAGVSPIPVTSGGKEFIYVDLAETGGQDITAATFHLAFRTSGYPESGDWFVPDSITRSGSRLTATQLIDTRYTAGARQVWARLIDDPEVIIRNVGTISIS